MTAIPDEQEPRLLVADSFRVRVRDGVAEARAFERHLERFRADATDAIAALPRSRPAARGTVRSDADLARFLREAAERIAAGGAGFPRIELWSDGRLEVAIRPLPALTSAIALVTARAPERPTPAIKGPNIPLYATLNRMSGAEALLVDERGRAIEGATTSLLWWSGSALCAVRGRDRVASVTESLVVDAARDDGHEVARADIAAEALPGHEVWAVNALHGIRPVTSIDGEPLPASDEARLERLRAALERTWRPVRAGSR